MQELVDQDKEISVQVFQDKQIPKTLWLSKEKFKCWKMRIKALKKRKFQG